MNCRRVEELIPLYVENDLDKEVMRGVSLHVSECEKCGKLLNEYQESQEWLRSQKTPEFDSAFFADLKQGVLREIECQRLQISFWKMLFGGRVKPILAAAFAFILLFAMAIFYYANSKSVASSQIANEVNTPFDMGAMVSQKTSSAKPALKRDSESHSLRRAVHRQRYRTPNDKLPVTVDTESSSIAENRNETNRVNTVANASSQEMTRIEFQTNDPKIRIIWFVPKSPESESSRELPKIDTE